MPRDQKGVETKPYILSINQIEMVQEESGTAKKTLKQMGNMLKKGGANAVLPIACLTEDVNQYQLLTGLPIYEAAKLAGLKEIWVFLIAAQAEEAQKWLVQVKELSKLNEAVINSQDISAFLEFVNNQTSDLTLVAGIGPKIAKNIRDNGPYNSVEELQNKLGRKRPLNWTRAFKQK